MFKKLHWCPLLGAILSVSLLCGASNHPFHTTLAETDWNTKSGSLEVALSLWPVDVEQVLNRSDKLKEQLGGPVDVDNKEQHPVLSPWIEKYVDSKLQGRVRGADRLNLEWVGFEVERDSLWCYFELKSDALVGKNVEDELTIEFENQLFFELHPDQQNTILYRQGKKRHALHFSPEHPSQSLLLNKR